jgi:hypothetical protein
MHLIFITILAILDISHATDTVTCEDYKSLYQGAGCCDANGNLVDTSVAAVIVKEEPSRTHAYKATLAMLQGNGLQAVPSDVISLFNGRTFVNTFWTHPSFSDFPYGKSDITFDMKDDRHVITSCDYKKDGALDSCNIAVASMLVKSDSIHHVVRFFEPHAKYAQGDGFKYGARYKDLYIRRDGFSVYYKSRTYLDVDPPDADVSAIANATASLFPILNQSGGPCGDNPAVESDWEPMPTGGLLNALYKPMAQLAEVTSYLPPHLGQCMAMTTFSLSRGQGD